MYNFLYLRPGHHMQLSVVHNSKKEKKITNFVRYDLYAGRGNIRELNIINSAH